MSSGARTSLLGKGGELQGERVPGKQYVRNDADRFDGMRQAGGRTAGLRLGSPEQRRREEMKGKEKTPSRHPRWRPCPVQAARTGLDCRPSATLAV